MGTASRIKEVAKLVQREDPVMVILSAMAGVTDNLISSVNSFRKGDIRAGETIFGQIRDKFQATTDELFGGNPSGQSIQGFLESKFAEMTQQVSGTISDEPDLPAIASLLSPLTGKGQSRLFITQGFLCRNHGGEIDNLKRGGRDYSATLIGAEPFL